MSYDLYIYDPYVKTMMDDGYTIEEIKVPTLPQEVIHSFRKRLEQYDYALVSENDECYEYKHTDQHWGINVSIFNSEICFSVPFWDEFDDAFFEARMTSAELCDSPALLVYDPQTSEWLEE